VSGTADRRGPIQSVGRALAVLDLLAAHDGLRLTDIARSTGLAAPTAHHLLATLINCEYASQSAGGLYTLGPAARALGRPGATDIDVVQAADPVLRRLAADTGESVLLAVLKGSALRTVSVLDSTRSIRASYGWEDLTGAAHATSVGKAALAWLPAHAGDDLLGGELRAYTDATVTERDALLDEMRLVRRHRVATDHGEFAEGLVSAAGTVRDANGAVLGAIACCLPGLRATPEVMRAVEQAVVAAADDLSAAMSTGGPAPRRTT